MNRRLTAHALHRTPTPTQNDALASTLRGWADVWPLLRRGDSDNKGYTFDATVNSLLERPRPDERMRYDRVMARMAEGGGCRPVGIEFVGTRPTKDGLFLSDHFGLMATFGAQEDTK